MFKDIKKGFSFSVGRLLSRVLFFGIIFVIFLLIGSCKAHAITTTMPNPTSSLEIYRNGNTYTNTTLNNFSWSGLSGKKNAGITDDFTGFNNPLSHIYAWYSALSGSTFHMEFSIVIYSNSGGWNDLSLFPYWIGSVYVEDINNTYHQCNRVGVPHLLNGNTVDYVYTCDVKANLSSTWNINYFLNYEGDLPSNDRFEFGITSGSDSTLVIDSNNVDVVNSINNMTDNLITNNNSNTQQIIANQNNNKNIIVNAITSIATTIGNFFSNLWSNISGAFTTLTTNLGTLFTNLWSNISNSFSSLFDYFDDILNDDEPTSQYLSNYIQSFPLFESNIVAQFITLPIHILTSFTGTQCVPVVLGSLFGTTLTIPCLGNVLYGILGSIYSVITWMISFFIYYRLIQNLRDTFMNMLLLEANVAKEFKIRM